MSIWTQMRDDLLSSDLALSVVWWPQPPGSPAILGLRALMVSRDRTGFLGDTRVTADAIMLELSRVALPRPARDDELDVTMEDVIARYRVANARPADDDRGLWWVIEANPLGCPCR